MNTSAYSMHNLSSYPQAPHGSSAVAVAAVILQMKPTMSKHMNIPKGSQCSPTGLMALPFEREGPGMFRIEPSLDSLMHWAASTVSPSYSPKTVLSEHSANLTPECSSVPLTLFFPISVASIAVPASTKGRSSCSSSRKNNRNIRKCCEKFNIAGIIFDVSPSSLLL